jgi:hypothetical protein
MFNRIVQALTDAPGYSTAPATDPESGERSVALVSEGWRRDALRRNS